MKNKLYFLLMAILPLLMVGCNDDKGLGLDGRQVVLTGSHDNIQTRTSFDQVREKSISFSWSKGDQVWVNKIQSKPLTIADDAADFILENLSGNAPYSVYYNGAGAQFDQAEVLPKQNQAEPYITELGVNGDFGYAETDKNGNFLLKHQAAYLWFSTYTKDVKDNNLVSITVSSPSKFTLSGKANFGENKLEVTEGSQKVVLQLGEKGFTLPSEPSDKVWAAMVVYPCDLTEQSVTITYTFADGKTANETKVGMNLEAGKTYQIEKEISIADLTKIVRYKADGGEWSEELPQQFTSLAVKTEFAGTLTPEIHAAIAKAMAKDASLDLSEAINESDTFDKYYANNTQLKSIILPNTTTKIGVNAFDHCSNLTDISIPEGVESIERSAFNYCTSLIQIKLPESVTELGKQAFYNCTSLVDITLPSGLEALQDYTFNNCSSLKQIQLPAQLKVMGSNLFNKCSALEEIEIPAGVTKLSGSGAMNSGMFASCEALKKVVLSEGLEEIGDQVFYSCYALEEINIPSTVKRIGKHALYDLRSLKSIYLDTEIIDDYGMWVSSGSSKLTEITFGPRVHTIGRNALLNANVLATITFESDNCPSIDSPMTFGDVGKSVEASSRKIFIPESSYDSYSKGLSFMVDQLGYTIIAGKGSLKDGVYFNETSEDSDWKESYTDFKGHYIYVKTVGNAVLTASQLKGLETKINNSPKNMVLDMSEATFESTTIEDNLFNNSTKLFEISFPKNIEVIGENVCSYNGELRAAILGSQVKEIGAYFCAKGFMGDNRVAFVCKAKTAPTFKDDGYPEFSVPFGGGDKLPLYVPQEAIPSYEAETNCAEYLIAKNAIVLTSLDQLKEYEWRAALK